MSHDPHTLPPHLSPAMLADRLTMVRDRYAACIAHHEAGLPQSATAEEIIATRTLNNLILDLSAKPKASPLKKFPL